MCIYPKIRSVASVAFKHLNQFKSVLENVIGKNDINGRYDSTDFFFLKEKLKEACYLRDKRGELIDELTTMIVQTVSNERE